MIPSSQAFVKHKHIVAVKMNGVGGCSRVGKVDAERAVGAKVIYVPLGTIWVRIVSLIG